MLGQLEAWSIDAVSLTAVWFGGRQLGMCGASQSSILTETLCNQHLANQMRDTLNEIFNRAWSSKGCG